MIKPSRVEAVLALDATDAEYTVKLSANEAGEVWRILVQKSENSVTLIDLINRDAPTLKLRAEAPSIARIDFAISRDSTGRIWLQVGMFCAGAEEEELQSWRERVMLLLAAQGAQTISAGHDETETYLTITGGTWP